MANDLQQLHRAQDLLMTRTSRQVTAYSKRGFSAKYKSNTGKIRGSFKPMLKRDRQTDAIWGAGVKARSEAFILNAGTNATKPVQAHTRTRGGKAHQVRSFTRRAIPAGNHISAAIQRVEPGFQTKAMQIWGDFAAQSIHLAVPNKI